MSSPSLFTARFVLLVTYMLTVLQNIQNDTGKLATSVAKERELSTRYIAELGASITAFKNTPMNVTAKTDPYVANSAVQRQLHKQVRLAIWIPCE